jgi:uncharacterized protein
MTALAGTAAAARAAEPVAAAERMDVLDVIRGFAVFGILLMNIIPFSGAMMFNLGDAASLPGARFDRAGEFFLDFAVHAKFYSLFSLLFGIGFAIFLDRAAARGADPARLFRRRLVGLLIIGLVHSIFIWFGDILNVYALLGFLLLPFRRSSNRTLLIWGLAACAAPIAIYGVALAVALAAGVHAAPGAGEGLPPFLVRAIQAFAAGTYLDVVRGNLVFTAAGWVRRILTLFIARMFGMFLIGVWAQRIGVFREPAQHRALLTRVCVWSFVLGVPASALGAWMRDPGVQLVPDVRGFIWTILLCVGSTGLCVFYASGLTLLFQKPAWRNRLMILAPVGSMALSNYLLQSVLAIAIFYGLGFGLYNDVSIVVALAIACGMFAIQVVLSRLWVGRAVYGPAEWVWRQFTYQRRFPLWRHAA